MVELDDQLRQLAAHRAESVPAFVPTAPSRRVHRRPRRRAAVITGIAACVAALLVIGGVAVFTGSDDSPSVRTPAASTGAPTATRSACPPLSGASGEARDGPAVQRPRGLQDNGVFIGVQATDCTDDVVFSFDRATPAWSMRYEPGPLTSDASGAPVEPAGSTWYVLRFPNLPPDVLGDNAYRVRSVAPSAVSMVERIAQPDGAEAWAIGLDQQRPFRVVAGDGVLRVQFERATPSVRTCTNSQRHFAYDVPAAWSVELTVSGNACTYFAPSPFVMCNSDCPGPIDYGGITVSPVASGFGDGTVLASRETTVAGGPATVRELEVTRAGMYPAGARVYEYSVDWAPDGTLTIWIGGDPGPDFDAKKAGLDAIAASVRRID
jgi:hypothetical protein